MFSGKFHARSAILIISSRKLPLFSVLNDLWAVSTIFLQYRSLQKDSNFSWHRVVRIDVARYTGMTSFKKYLCRMNCGVIQGFPALRKAVTTHVKKYRIFSTCVDIANQLLTRHSPLAPLGQIDKWTAKPLRFSIQIVCKSFLELWRLNTKKIHIAERLWVQTFLEWEWNHYTTRKTESYIFSGFGVSISLGWELKSTTGRFATGRFWPFTWKTSSVGKDKVNKWEFCKLKITTIVALYDFYSGIVDLFIFIHQWSRLFFSVEGYCVYMINKIIHGCL